MTELQNIINRAWDDRSLLKDEITINAIREVIDLLDMGILRVAEPVEGGWQVNEWVKKAVVLYFPIQKMQVMESGIFEYHDKIPLKKGYQQKEVRVVPHAVARHGSYIAPGTILMPSYVNIGAYVDSGTMVDTWATVGSCAQIGKNVHLSGGVGIGGVLEPLQAAPVIIEDNAFIGPCVAFTNDKHPRSKQYPEEFLRTVVEAGASIGANATILPGIRIGKKAMVGAGAVVTKDVPENAIVVGNPAVIKGFVEK